jgi:hypothetical protein
MVRRTIRIFSAIIRHDAAFDDEIIWDMIGHLEFRELRVDIKLHAF